MFRERDLVRLVLQLNPYAPTPDPPPVPFVPTMIFCPPPGANPIGAGAGPIAAAAAAVAPIAGLDAALDANIAPDFTSRRKTIQHTSWLGHGISRGRSA
jgi:hypothetical protein